MNGLVATLDGAPAGGRAPRLSWLLGPLLACWGAYAAVFWLLGDLTPLRALSAAATNVLPLILLAPLLHVALRTWVHDAAPTLKFAAHAAAAPVFSAAWYGTIIIGQAVERAATGGRFEVIGFSGPGLTWQLLQGLTVYAALAGISYGLSAVRGAPAQAGAAPPAAELKRLLVRSGDLIRPVAAEDIVAVTGAQDYAEVSTAGGRHLARISLAELEARLDPLRFVRVHRSAIVNLDHLTSAEPAGNGRLLLQLSNGASLATSRAGARKLRELVF